MALSPSLPAGGGDERSRSAHRHEPGRAAHPQQCPRLRLDELLDELQVRIDEVRGTRDRLNGLLEA
ncbi:hypothetical protein ACR3S4_01755, partial [Streptomyces sp. CH8.1]|uniref:hypothetical protein n=1 Tax=Streptomyces sp. CH8.1 TaxID=3439546 RepID=UPI003DA0AE8F